MESQLDKLGSENKYLESYATSNGLRQQSITRGAEIKVSCISNILPRVCCYVEH